MEHVRRGMAYCVNPDCEDNLKGRFRINFSGYHECSSCGDKGGWVEHERTEQVGEGPWKRVEVHYRFDPNTRWYERCAIIQDDAVPAGVTFKFYSPMIVTNNRASAHAERILSNLCMGNSHHSAVVQLSWDKPIDEYRVDLAAWGLVLAGSDLKANAPKAVLAEDARLKLAIEDSGFGQF